MKGASPSPAGERGLEIESFYIFAKILLDRIADTFIYFYNISSLRKMGSSYSQLTKSFDKICTERGFLIEPPDLPTLIYPTADSLPENQTETQDLDGLLAEVDHFILAILTFFETNIGKSVLSTSTPTSTK
jgi:hypothetical protein